MQGLLYVIYFALLLISPEVFAGVFDPPPTDKSISLLGMIFGDSIGSIYLGGNANPVLASLMEKFNFILVVAGSIVVSYVAVLSTINTAQEGTAMGKKWSAVWIPMRSVAGMALLVPGPGSGYSMIQVTVMWIVLQGIGAADQLWTIALNGLTSGVSAAMGAAKSTDPGIASDANDIVPKILHAAICMETFYQASKDQISGTTGNPIHTTAWTVQNGNYVKSFSVQNATVTTPSAPNNGPYGDCATSATNPNGCYAATITGTVYFGVDRNDPSNPDQSVCGKLFVTASVSSTEFPITKGLNSPAIVKADIDKAVQNAYNVKINTIASVLAELSPLAKMLVNDTYSPAPYNTANDPVAVPSKIPVPDGSASPAGYVAAARDAYIKGMSSLAVNGAVGSTGGSFGQANIMSNADSIKKIVQAGTENGWISAGSFYFIFNNTLVPKLLATATGKAPTQPGGLPSNQRIDDKANQSDPGFIPALKYDSTVKPSDFYGDNLVDPSDYSTTFASTSNNLNNLGDHTSYLIQYLAYGDVYMADDAKSSGISSAFGSSAGGQDQIAGMAGGANALMLENLKNITQGGAADPLMAHAIFGRGLMIAAEVAMSAMLVVAIAMSFSTVQATVLGTGFSIGEGPMLLVMFITTMLFGYFGAMWAMGASLAIYAPFIPFMIFDLAALGWMLTVVEAIIAAPIIALGLVMPAGDEMGKLSTALMLLANIFLRPLLMIFGFLLAGGVFRAIVNLIDFGMADVLESIQVNTMFSSIALVAVYCTFIISTTNLSFSLIYAVPDKILRWLGVSGEQTSVSPMSDVKQASSKASSQIGGALEQNAGGASNALGKRAAEGAGKGGSVEPQKGTNIQGPSNKGVTGGHHDI